MNNKLCAVLAVCLAVSGACSSSKQRLAPPDGSSAPDRGTDRAPTLPADGSTAEDARLDSAAPSDVSHPDGLLADTSPADTSRDGTPSETGSVDAADAALDALATSEVAGDIPAADRDGAASEAGAAESGDGGRCITLGDVPWVQLVAADSSTSISSLTLLSGPCSMSSRQNTVEFHYWDLGYSCPSYGDTVTCQIQAKSASGSVAEVSLTFAALPFGMSDATLYWAPQGWLQGNQLKVPFPAIDAGGTEAGRD